MTMPSPALVAFTLLMTAWLVFVAVFVFRPRAARATEIRRDRFGTLGIALQTVGYAIVWSTRRGGFELLLGVHTRARWHYLLAIVIGLLAFASALLTLAAVRALGKQWALAARLVASHELIRTGPYALVRHPIYTGMLGLLVATALTLTHPLTIVPAVALFVIGTLVRTHAEERLLRSAFGGAYDDYARKVPTLIPWRLPR